MAIAQVWEAFEITAVLLQGQGQEAGATSLEGFDCSGEIAGAGQGIGSAGGESLYFPEPAFPGRAP